MIILTRALKQALLTKGMLQEVGEINDIIIEPMIQVSAVSSKLSPIDRDCAVLITSANAFENRMISIYSGLPLLCVGCISQELARDIGFTNSITAGDDVSGLIDYISSRYLSGSNFLYLRGEHVSMDLARCLSSRGFNVVEQIVYCAKETENFSAEFLDLINCYKFSKKVVALYSARTAQIFFSLLGKHSLVELFRDANFCAISPRVAQDVLFGRKWIADSPGRGPMLKLIIEAALEVRQ